MLLFLFTGSVVLPLKALVLNTLAFEKQVEDRWRRYETPAQSRHLANGEIYITPDQNGALQDVLTSYWNRNIPVEKVQKDIVSALRN